MGVKQFQIWYFKFNKVRDLLDEQLAIQQRALVCLTELFHSAENVSQGINENIIPNLISFLNSINITSRQKASESLMIISNHEIGRRAILVKRDNIIIISKRVFHR